MLSEFGLYLPDDVEVRVQDSNQKHRFMVMPMRPEGTDGWTEDQLTEIVTRDCLIGVALPKAGVTTNVITDTRPAIHPGADEHVQSAAIDASLEEIVERNQVWPRMAAKYGVENPVRRGRPAWTGCATPSTTPPATRDVPTFKERRDEEDALSATVYSDLPYPENQLVALAHSLLARGVIAECELVQRLSAIRARLEG